jgi:membrane-bound lytic murein transglycosylase B
MKDQLKNQCGKLKQVCSITLILVALSACSSNQTIPSADAGVAKDEAVAQAAVQQSSQLTLEARKAQLEEIKARKLAQRKHELEKIKAVKRAQQLAQQNRQKRHHASSSRGGQLKNTGKAHQLTGEFSRNPKTRAFINKMVSQHGFDRTTMNYVLSKAKSTPFLKRMAYKDGLPRRPKNKNTGVRAGSWAKYRGNFLTSRTINKGLQFWNANRSALQRAEQRYGVPQEYILGIIGVETRYGQNVGTNRTVDALATMGFNNARRGHYFTSELESYLIMARRAGLDPLQPKASYAGAIGLCQFMPSNVKKYGVDHDGSGSCNLWTAADAIGSVANYFKQHGWRTGGPVVVKASTNSRRYKSLKWGFKSKYSLNHLKNYGVLPASRNIDRQVSLIRLGGARGEEVWLGGHNFYVITRYNHSSKYAMAVHQLAQALKQRRYGGRVVSR